MWLMIIFLLLSVVLIISTLVYLNYKKKNTKATKIKSTKEKSKKRTKKQLIDILDIEIKNNIICIGNRYSNVIRLGNIDYNMLSTHEQDAIESVLIQTALAIDFPVQFFSTTEYIDTSKVVLLIKENKPINEKIKEYKNYLTNYLQELMENRSISIIRNYAIISYDGTYENAIDELNRKSTSFKGNLLRAKIICEVLNEDELYNLIYRELNKNSVLNIGNLKEGGKQLYVGKKQKRKAKRD